MSGDEQEGYSLARDPDEVPTPLAIAAADFCRRAGRAASPEAVRLALARLEPHEDDELRALVDAEPPGRPLGPEALVDLVRGLSVDEATAREEAGYYLAMALAPRQKQTPRARVRESAPAPQESSREARRKELLSAL